MFELIDFLVVRPIANILFVIYNFVGDFGLAIILFTILVKLAMWPLTKRQFHQTKLMRKLQPEITKIKKQCKGNRQMESIQTMALYKKHNVKPFRSILSLVIQIPIFIAIFTAIRVMVMPTPTDNLEMRAYEFNQTAHIADVIEQQQAYLADPENNTYDFHPQLFGVVNLDAKVTNLFSENRSLSDFVILLFALAAAVAQYFAMRQQMPKNTDKKKKKGFRQLMKEAANGKEPDQSEINTMMTGQMSTLMPIMMMIIMIPLPGALVFYYLLINLINLLQQYFVFKKDDKEMEIAADKSVIRELNKIQEAEVIENKKTGTKITRISAKEKKKSNKSNKKRSKK